MNLTVKDKIMSEKYRPQFNLFDTNGVENQIIFTPQKICSIY